MTKHLEDMASEFGLTVEELKEPMEEEFELRDGTRVTWGEATIAQHEEHKQMLIEEAARDLRTVAQAEAFHVGYAIYALRAIAAGEVPTRSGFIEGEERERASSRAFSAMAKRNVERLRRAIEDAEQRGLKGDDVIKGVYIETIPTKLTPLS